jgi:pimeloyl-ACP methyl ester carboxylesterase
VTAIRTTTVAGTPVLRCREAGARTGDALVLLHSLGTDSGIWSAQIAALAAELRVLAPDSRGHGGSSWHGPLDVAGWVGDLDRVLDDANVERATLAGLSMGGVQALAYALDRPGRVAGLVLADTFAELDPGAAAAKVSRLAGAAEAQGMAALADAYAAETLTGSPPPERVRAVRDPIAAMSVEAYVASARACFGARLGARLGEVAAPTLVLWGERDERTPRALAERLARDIPDAALLEIAGAGHLANLENPEAFTAALARFAVGAPAGAGRR